MTYRYIFYKKSNPVKLCTQKAHSIMELIAVVDEPISLLMIKDEGGHIVYKNFDLGI